MSRSDDIDLGTDLKGLDSIRVLNILTKTDYVFSSDMKILLDKGITQSWRYVSRLQKNGLVESGVISGRRYLMLSSKAINEFKIKRESSYLVHSLYTSNFLSAVKKHFPDFIVGWPKDLVDDWDDLFKKGFTTITPDGFFETESFRIIGVEIELTQKSESRLVSKIDRYLAGDHNFDRVIYYFKSDRLLKKFMKLIDRRIDDFKNNKNKADVNFMENLFILTSSSIPFNFIESLPYMYCYSGPTWEYKNLIDVIKKGEMNG